MLDEVYFERITGEKTDEMKKRHLDFSGVKNFRDLGGYQTITGKTVRWHVLYRADALHKLTNADLQKLSALMLEKIIDFRAEHEKEHEPDRLPLDMNIQTLALPILDSSTKVWHDARAEFVKNLKNIDPETYMIQTNVELATRFTPEMKQFVHEVLAASGQPILFHCAAGKDRTGFGAAILLRMLGVPQAVVMEDYLLTNEYFLPPLKWSLAVARVMKGKQFAASLRGFMEARPAYLSAAFDAVDREYGSFEAYVHNGLGLTEQDVERLRNLYLES